MEAETAGPKRVKYPHTRSHSLIIVFLLSCLPGAAHMYMGLMKRGLLLMSSFFMSIWLASEFGGSPFLAFLIVIVCVAGFFDAFNIRRRIVMGEYVDDTISDLVGFIKRFKLPIIIFLVYILATSALRTGYYGFYTPFMRPGAYPNFNFLIPVGIIVFVIKALSGGKKRKISRDEPIDKRDDIDAQ